MAKIDLTEGWVMLLVGVMLLIGYAAHLLGKRLHIPRVTLLILVGVACGPFGLNLVPDSLVSWFPYAAHFALATVGFLLGSHFTQKRLKRMGASILWMPLVYVLVAASMVFAFTFFTDGSFVAALLLAGIAPASDPAATIDVVRETEATGPLADTLLRVVAVDDAYGIIVFSLLLAAGESIIGTENSYGIVLAGLWEIVGAILLGALLGLPMAWLTGRIRKGETALMEAVGFVFLCGGLATLMHVSYLLACMTLGAVVANFGKHHTRPFHAIEGASDPFLALFFVMAGFRLDLGTLANVGLLGIAFVLARSFGLVLGARIGASLAHAPKTVRKHLGWCLLPQAGVALGMALLVAERLPEYGQRLLPLVIATTVFFEIVGPIVAQRHLRLAANSLNLQTKT